MDEHRYNQDMNADTVRRLLSLNEQFYQTFGQEFSSTRQRLQPGVRRVLDSFLGDESQLDLGCGNGELARERRKRGHTGLYAGLDLSEPLLAAARLGWDENPPTFLQADLCTPGWEACLEPPLPRVFDLVTAFAVLHHIPGEQLRQDIMKSVHVLLRPGGKFIHSVWQFMNSEKLKRRLQPWQEIGLRDQDLEPGDALLDWRRGGRGLRYVHAFRETELTVLAEQCGFRVGSSFLSDGEQGRLGLYQVWEVV